jgi:hypothetical protein
MHACRSEQETNHLLHSTYIASNACTCTRAHIHAYTFMHKSYIHTHTAYTYTRIISHSIPERFFLLKPHKLLHSMKHYTM